MARPAVTATTRTSAPGSERGATAPWRIRAAQVPRGFTLLELLVVLLLVAIASGVMTLALRDSDAGALEQEAARLAALLESARAESRVSGQPVSWRPLPPGGALAAVASGVAGPPDFEFTGLGRRSTPPQQWLAVGQVQARVLANEQRIWLGPDAVLPAQAVELRRGRHVVRVASDGLGPFAAQPVAQADAVAAAAVAVAVATGR
jgi:general secretion pathway protein H